MVKKFLLLLLALFVVTGCFGTEEDEVQEDYNDVEDQRIHDDPTIPIEPDVDDEEEALPLMTVEQVAENNGVDGANAYVIVNNIVYDVTDSPRWLDGLHNDFQAGQDLTDEIENISPHGLTVLDRMEKVGRIAD